MSDRVVLSVGTKKGLFVFTADAKRNDWKLQGPFIKGWSVYHAVVDARNTPQIYVASSTEAFATNVLRADLSKMKFEGAKKPPVPPKLTAKQAKASKQWGIPTAPRTWHVEPGRKNEKGVLYAGVAPAGLYRTEDGGKSWEPFESLNNHPTRKNWMPGYGGMGLHTIQLDPNNEKRMYVGISAAGAFRTDDGGKSWKPINNAVAKFVGAPKDSQVGT